MHNLVVLGIFFAGFFGGLALFFASCGWLWWVSLLAKSKE